MSLLKLKSIFQDELQERVESFKSVQPIDRFSTKLNYNETPFNENAFTFSADLTQRGGTFIIETDNKVSYSYKAQSLLSYSSTMNKPLQFLDNYLSLHA